MKSYPFVSQNLAFHIARIITALFFLAHALGRIVLGTIPNFAEFMAGQGFPYPTAVVWVITLTEIVSAVLLIANRLVRPATFLLGGVVFWGIVLIHARLGWWVGEHGTGGSEYSVALLTLLLLIAAHDRGEADIRV